MCFHHENIPVSWFFWDNLSCKSHVEQSLGPSEGVVLFGKVPCHVVLCQPEIQKKIIFFRKNPPQKIIKTQGAPKEVPLCFEGLVTKWWQNGQMAVPRIASAIAHRHQPSSSWSASRRGSFRRSCRRTHIRFLQPKQKAMSWKKKTANRYQVSVKHGIKFEEESLIQLLNDVYVKFNSRHASELQETTLLPRNSACLERTAFCAEPHFFPKKKVTSRFGSFKFRVYMSSRLKKTEKCSWSLIISDFNQKDDGFILMNPRK